MHTKPLKMAKISETGQMAPLIKNITFREMQHATTNRIESINRQPAPAAIAIIIVLSSFSISSSRFLSSSAISTPLISLSISVNFSNICCSFFLFLWSEMIFSVFSLYPLGVCFDRKWVGKALRSQIYLRLYAGALAIYVSVCVLGSGRLKHQVKVSFKFEKNFFHLDPVMHVWAVL